MRQSTFRVAVGCLGVLLWVSGCDRSPTGTPATWPAAAAPRDPVERDVLRITSELLGVRLSELHSGIHLERDLKADDLDRVELTMELEDHFEISIPDEDFDRLQTLGQVADYVRAKKKK